MNDITTVVFARQGGYDPVSVMYLKGMVPIGILDGWNDRTLHVNLSMKEFKEICKNVEVAHTKGNTL